MKLSFNNFVVDDIIFGDNTSFKNNVLTINKQEVIDYLLAKDSHLTTVDLVIAKPGDNIRIVPVKDAVEPRCRVNGDSYFSGVTGKVARVGGGEVNCLKNMSILGVGQNFGSFGDGMIDMSGEGAKYTYYSSLINLCVVCETDEEAERYEQQKKNTAIRYAILHLSEYLAKYSLGQTASYRQEYAIRPKFDDKLPNIAYVIQAQSQLEEPGYNTMFYGWDMNNYLPTIINPNEMLDGAFVSGSFMPCSSKWSTYDYMNAPIIRELYDRDGKDLNFVGVIASNLNVSLEQKTRSAMIVGTLSKMLRADGVILGEEGYGNPDTDFILCIEELERIGVKTVGITNEVTGRDGLSQPLVVVSEIADAIVSCGNVSELIELPPMQTVVGNLNALKRDGLSGGWAHDDLLGPSVRKDGSIIMENNSMFCGDQVIGFAKKTVSEY